MTPLNDTQTPQKRRSPAVTVLTILVIALAGPGLGLVLWAFGLALAPPWTFLTSLIYEILACIGLPLGLVAAGIRRLRIWWLLASLGLTGIAAILLLALVGPELPTGMTTCQPLMAPAPQARYACVSTSSDNTNFRYEFMLEGWANWPVMRMVNQKLSR